MDVLKDTLYNVPNGTSARGGVVHGGRAGSSAPPTTYVADSAVSIWSSSATRVRFPFLARQHQGERGERPGRWTTASTSARGLPLV